MCDVVFYFATLFGKSRSLFIFLPVSQSEQFLLCCLSDSALKKWRPYQAGGLLFLSGFKLGTGGTCNLLSYWPITSCALNSFFYTVDFCSIPVHKSWAQMAPAVPPLFSAKTGKMAAVFTELFGLYFSTLMTIILVNKCFCVQNISLVCC